jgi:hypothetical protein
MFDARRFRFQGGACHREIVKYLRVVSKSGAFSAASKHDAVCGFRFSGLGV